MGSWRFLGVCHTVEVSGEFLCGAGQELVSGVTSFYVVCERYRVPVSPEASGSSLVLVSITVKGEYGRRLLLVFPLVDYFSWVSNFLPSLGVISALASLCRSSVVITLKSGKGILGKLNLFFCQTPRFYSSLHSLPPPTTPPNPWWGVGCCRQGFWNFFAYNYRWGSNFFAYNYRWGGESKPVFGLLR